MALQPMMVYVSSQISGPHDADLAVAGAIFSALIGHEGHVRSLIRLNEVSQLRIILQQSLGS